MSLFICENCGVIENTALGHFWAKDAVKFKDSNMNGKALCSECAPCEYEDGSKSKYGKWHGKFPREKFNPEKHDKADFVE